MARQVLSRVDSEPNWVVVCSNKEAAEGISFHPVCGWAIVSDGDKVSYLPTTLGGEILSDRPNYLGIIGPNEDYKERTLHYMNTALNKSEGSGVSENIFSIDFPKFRVG